jgi:ribosomal protein L30E
LYVISTWKTGEVFYKKLPKHIIISGNVPKDLRERTDTLIQIPQRVSVERCIFEK